MPTVFKNKKILYLSSIFIAGIVIILSLFIFQKNQEGATATEWYDESWYYRQQFTIDSTKIDEDLENFPIAVQFNTTTNPYTNTNSDGSDIRFTDNSGNLLSYEIETWNESGTSTVHVKIPTISAGADTKFYMYYGNPSAQDAQDAQNVWDENFVGVWHLGEGDSTSTAFYQDSTGNNNHGTLTDINGTTQAVDGVVDGGLDFVTSGDYIDAGGAIVDSYPFTLSVWVSFNSLGNYGPITIANESVANQQIGFGTNNDGESYKWRIWNYDGSFTDKYGSEVTTNTWYHAVAVYNSDTDKKLYINGELDITWTDNEPIPIGLDNMNIGRHGDSSPNAYLVGMIDNVDVSNTPRTPAWIKASYHSGNGTLLSTAAEEQGPGPVGYWSFDDGYGTTASDMTVNNNDGTITGATWKNESECVSGKCLSFDGSGYVSVPNSSEFTWSTGDNFSISVWLKVSSHNSSFREIVRPGNTGDSWFLLLNSSNKIALSTSGAGSEYNDGYLYPADNEWHHVGATFDGSIIRIYLDGNLVTSYSGSGPSQNSQTLYFGSLYSGSQFYTGGLDEVKIYNYARTADQIKQDYNRGKAVFFGSTANNDSSLTDGLVGYWKFDESTANTCTGGVNDSCDSSGLGNNGAWNGDASAITTAKFGRGVAFDGSGDYVSVADDSSLDQTGNAFSMAAWIRYASGSSGERSIMSKGTWETGNYQYRLNPSNKLTWWVNEFTPTNISSSETLSADTWYHTTIIYDGAYMNIYINGELDTQTKVSGTITNNSSAFQIGARSTDTYFNGAIDEVRIYNRALNPEEVRRLYEYAPGPVGWWKLDENSGTSSVYDSSGNGNTGTMNGAMTAEDWVPGKYGSALEFDGGDDFINANNSLSLHDNITAMAWVKTTETGAIISNRYSDPDYGTWYTIKTTNLELGDNSQGGYSNQSYASNIRDGKWHHVAYTKNGNLHSVYIDGVMDANYPVTKVVDITQNVPFYIAKRWTIESSQDFNGQIDDVRIYNYARTQKQILEDMHAGRPNNPVAYYSFDEMQGTTANDRGYLATDFDSGNDGTLTNMSTSGTSTAWTPNGRKGGALSFDGVDDYVSVGTELISQDTTKGFSISTWVNSAGLSFFGAMKIVDQSDSGSPYNGFQFGINTSNEFNLYIRDNDGDYITQEFVVPSEYDNSWVHLVATYNGSKNTNGIKLYANGELLESLADSSGSLDDSVSTSGKNTVIAARNNGVSQYFKGLIDEVKIYNYALTLDEIRQEYNTGFQTKLSSPSTSSGQPTNGLVGWWKMDEASWAGNSGEVIDYSGAGNHGTAVNSVNSTSTAKYGRAGDFTANGADYVSIGIPVLNTPPFTVSLWEYNTDVTNNYQYMIANGAQTSSYGLSLDIDSSGNYRFAVRDSAGLGGTVSAAATTGWNMVVGTWDGTANPDSIKLYKNGVLVASGQPTPGSPNSPQNLRIGIPSNTTSYNFQGIIDDVKIYNYARTPEQIMADYVDGPPPIAWWKMDDNDGGTTAVDSSGSGNSGTLTGDPTWQPSVDCKAGSCLRFDGVDDYVVTNSVATTKTNNISMSGWFNWSGASGNDAVFYNGNTGSSGYGIFIHNGSCGDGNKLVVLIGGLNCDAVTSAVTVTPNVWTHFVLTRGDSTWKLYVNGVLEETGTTNPNTPSGALVSGANHLGLNGFFTGLTDDLKFWDYELTPRQVALEYSGGAPVAWYKFDEGEGGTVYDWSGNSNDGTIYPGTGGSNTSTSTMWAGGVSGKLNGSLEFDGTDDYVSVGTDSVLNWGNGNGSISAWIKTSKDYSSSYGVIAINGAGGLSQKRYLLHVDGDDGGSVTNRIRFDIDDDGGGGLKFVTGNTINDGVWHHVVGVRSDNRLLLYVDGVSVGSTDISGYGSIDDTDGFTIGASNNPGCGGSGCEQYFDGLIDDVRIYNYALTPVEVKKEYNSGFVNYFQ